MIIDISAEARHKVHHAPTITGCIMTSKILVAPSGPTAMPNSTTIQGFVFHLSSLPIRPDTISITYPNAPNNASGIGNAFDTEEVNTRFVPSPKKGSQTVEKTPNWYIP